MPAYLPFLSEGGMRKHTSKILLFVKLNYLILNQFVLAGEAERKQPSNNPKTWNLTTQLTQSSYSSYSNGNVKHKTIATNRNCFRKNV